MAVEVHVAPVFPDKNAVPAHVSVSPTVLAEFAVMMVAVARLVVCVQRPKVAKTEFVLAQPLLNVQGNHADQIVPEEVAVLANQAKNVGTVNVSATIVVTKGIAEMQCNLTEPILRYVPKDLVGHAQMVFLVEQQEDAQPYHLVQFLSLSWTVRPDVRSQ